MGRFVGLVLVLVACGSGGQGVQFENIEGRTLSQVESEMSCGCPAGHTLVCGAPDGGLSYVSNACVVSERGLGPDDVPMGFSLYYADILVTPGSCDYERSDDPDENLGSLIASLFCVPN